MFAFALYDEIKNNLILVRDRYGIKPLYYQDHANNKDDRFIRFASEIKAFEINKNNIAISFGRKLLLLLPQRSRSF